MKMVVEDDGEWVTFRERRRTRRTDGRTDRPIIWELARNTEPTRSYKYGFQKSLLLVVCSEVVDKDGDAVFPQVSQVVELLPVGRGFGGRMGGAKRKTPSSIGTHRGTMRKTQLDGLVKSESLRPTHDQWRKQLLSVSFVQRKGGRGWGKRRKTATANFEIDFLRLVFGNGSGRDHDAHTMRCD